MDEAFLNDLLECSVCLEQLDGSSKVLPCQHTFCKRCLDEIVNSHKELRCPECRVLVEIKIEDLPSNILLIRLLEGIKNNPRLKQPSSNVKKDDVKLPSQHFIPPRTFSQVPPIRQATPVSSEPKAVLKQPPHATPCAKAIYNYEGKEPGDLSFKKGDAIFLQRRIDQNWYHGEVNGKYGFVPARYVRVVVPLPTHIPQCKALYDFSVAENDEKDCLIFSKGEVITVIRRVDDNWAEGKLGEQIGIFPISFVEMNVAARSLMKLSVNTQPGPSRVAPPTPTLDSSLSSTTPASKLNGAGSDATPQALDLLSSTTTTPSSSTTPSPSTPPSSSNSSSSLPQPPPILPPKDAILDKPSILTRSASQRHSHSREKRHSLSSICATSSSQKSPQIPVTHKHSSEILSTSGGDILAAPNRTVPESTAPAIHLPIPSRSSPIAKEVKEEQISRFNRRHLAREPGAPKLPAARASTSLSPAVSTSTTTPASNCASSVPPIIYVALYNYRPQKEDELELKKGEFYTVSEKCQDGWFKGTSLRTTRSGVFPGNYVHFAKSTQNQIQFLQSPAFANLRITALNLKSLLPVSSAVPRQKPPVPAPPAQSTAENAWDKKDSAPAYSQSRPPTSQEMKTSIASELLEWARSVTTATSVSQQSTLSDAIPSASSIVNQESRKDTGMVPPSPSKPLDIVPWLSKLVLSTPSFQPPAIAQPSAMTASYPSANGPDTASLPISSSTDSISQSWHAGAKPHQSSPFSYHVAAPSMAIVSPPNVSLRAPPSASGHSSHTKSDKHKVRKDKTRESLMKRFTGKKRTRVPVANFSCDNPTFVDSIPHHGSHNSADVGHVRSGSCPSEVLSRLNANQPKSINPIKAIVTGTPKSGSHLKQPSLVRERFRCVVPYPPNSEYELELKIGDIVYVHKKREDGWYKGTLLRTGKTGLFPASFVDLAPQ